MEAKTFESDQKITIGLEEYKFLIRTQQKYDTITSWLLRHLDLSMDGYSPWLPGRESVEILEQFEPMAFDWKLEQLREEKKKNEEAES